MIGLIKPIVHMITAFQPNEPQIHTITTKFNNLEAVLNEKLPPSLLNSTAEKAILTKFKERIEFDLSMIHLAANLLDPAAQGCKLKPIKMLNAISFVCETEKYIGLDVCQV